MKVPTQLHQANAEVNKKPWLVTQTARGFVVPPQVGRFLLPANQLDQLTRKFATVSSRGAS